MIEERKNHMTENIAIFLAVLFKYLINFNITYIVLYGCLLCFLFFGILTLIRKSISKKEFVRCLIFLIISLFFVFEYHDANFLIAVMLAIICLKDNEERFIKTFFISSVILYTFTILCFIFDFLPEHNLYRYNDGEYIIRYSLGFKHPNEVFLFFLPIALSGYYLYSEKKIYYFSIFIISTILNYISDCRTGYIVILMLILLGVFSNILKKTKFNKIVPYLFGIFTIITFIIAIIFGNDFKNPINILLSGRPFYWNYYIDSGKFFSVLGDNYVTGYFLDNFYMYLLVRLGMLSYLIYGWIYYKSLKKMDGNNKYMIIAFIFLLYGILEMNLLIGSIQFLFAIQITRLINVKELQ